MAAVAEHPTFAEPAPTKKGRTKRALKPKAVSSNEANIAAGAVTEPSPVAAKGKQQQLQEMQEQLEKLMIKKEKTEEMLKAKEEQLETLGREQEKLKIELRKLLKIKEFKPTVTFPLGLGIKDLEQEKKEKKPSPPYVLWCKDQWNEVEEAKSNAKVEELKSNNAKVKEVKKTDGDSKDGIVVGRRSKRERKAPNHLKDFKLG